MFKKNIVFITILDILLILAGTAIYAFGLYYFIEPNNVAPGGVAGISILLNYLFALPVGLVTTTINIPLLIIGWRYLGKEFIWKTLLSLVGFTVFYDYIFSMITPFTDDKLLACLFGGVMMGVGLGIVFLRAGSTGGMDIVNKLLNRRFEHIPLGKITLYTDLVVIAVSVFVFDSIDTVLYAIIVIFLASQLIDTVISGGDKGKLIYIFSSNYKGIVEKIMTDVNRGVTLLNGEGAYTGEERHVIVCVVRNNEYYKVKRVVYEIDPQAFIVTADASEVAGNGFKPIDRKQ